MSDATWMLACSLLCINLIGITWTFWLVLHGIPDSQRIQARQNSAEVIRERLPYTLFNVLLLGGGACVAVEAFPQFFSLAWLGWFPTLAAVVFIIFLDDTYFYWFHRTLHENKFLYNKIHRIHHRAFRPVPMDYMYAHPLEWGLGTLGPTLGVLILCLWTGPVNMPILLLYQLVRTSHEFVAHCGAKSVIRLPYLAPAEHHDLHHAKPTLGNYGSYFLFWDRWMGTAHS